MSPWALGSAKVEQLIASGSIQRLARADSGTQALIERAHQLIRSAESLAKDDPVTAYVVAYDGARHSGAALLAAQCLRATAAGGHVALEKVISAQFGGNFTKFGALRRRRHELDYPVSDEDFADLDEAMRAISTANQIVNDAQTILRTGQLTTF